MVIDHDLAGLTDDTEVLEKLGIDPSEAQFAPEPEAEEDETELPAEEAKDGAESDEEPAQEAEEAGEAEESGEDDEVNFLAFKIPGNFSALEPLLLGECERRDAEPLHAPVHSGFALVAEHAFHARCGGGGKVPRYVFGIAAIARGKYRYIVHFRCFVVCVAKIAQ